MPRHDADTSPVVRRLAIGSRFGAAILGGFVFTFGFVAVAVMVGFVSGLRFYDSQTVAGMLSLPVYLGVLTWGFAARSIARVWLVLLGGGMLSSAAAWALSRAILQ